MTDVYRIKPLVWEKISDDYVSVVTVFGWMYVVREDEGWFWRWCFKEYYDDGEEPCGGLEDGKQKAEEFYREKLMEALEKVEALTTWEPISEKHKNGEPWDVWYDNRVRLTNMVFKRGRWCRFDDDDDEWVAVGKVELYTHAAPILPPLEKAE